MVIVVSQALHDGAQAQGRRVDFTEFAGCVHERKWRFQEGDRLL